MQVQAGARASMLEPYRDYVRERFERYQLSAVRLIEEIRPMGYAGSLSTLRRYSKDYVHRPIGLRSSR